MKTINAQPATHQIEGEFLGFIPLPGGESKYMQFRVGERIVPIKLAKELRATLGQQLTEGDRLAVFLEKSGSGLGSLKLRTDHVERLDADNKSSVFKSAASQQGKILLCYNSSCSKRGGKQLYYALVETLKQLGLQDRVKIELTGCQKQCKQAPSFILMPGRVRHAYVNPRSLASLLAAHYSEAVSSNQ
ncbi:MAG: (2Fe-2S) ferredoxin domain-containing protein [Cyanophyceae cyanobacterium]